MCTPQSAAPCINTPPFAPKPSRAEGGHSLLALRVAGGGCGAARRRACAFPGLYGGRRTLWRGEGAADRGETHLARATGNLFERCRARCVTLASRPDADAMRNKIIKSSRMRQEGSPATLPRPARGGRGNMSSDEESSSHSEEEDEVGELPEIDEEEMRKIQERGGKRRFSVSSESASSVKCVELPTPPGLHAQHAPRAASRGRPLSRAQPGGRSAPALPARSAPARHLAPTPQHTARPGDIALCLAGKCYGSIVHSWRRAWR